MTAVKCPNCSNKVSWNRESKFRPFCSERCKMIDLGAWASGVIRSRARRSARSTRAPTPRN
ncbi:MAG: DNA gyrase inhibitor YacG [Pseudomonadota bacterium]|nr:DNA gyrase inhibitor YacG [Pseudomonadota bacterium]